MDKLIEALQIFLRYDNPQFPTHCENHELCICGDFHPDKISDEDFKKLSSLGFNWDAKDDSFKSHHFGST